MTTQTSTSGEPLPEIRFGPISRTTLALYAGASGDHNPVHIDFDFARRAGLPDVFAHGMLSFGVLARVATDWAGVGKLRSFGVRFVAITQVHDEIFCTGTVVERFTQNGETLARLNLTATTQDGRQTLVGEAICAIS
jgi:acyl dehydratase